MQQYLNVDGDSNVEAYNIGIDYIDVKFFGTVRIYRYSYSSAGKENVEVMKRLAQAGNGLNSFINRNVRNRYER